LPRGSTVGRVAGRGRSPPPPRTRPGTPESNRARACSPELLAWCGRGRGSHSEHRIGAHSLQGTRLLPPPVWYNRPHPFPLPRRLYGPLRVALSDCPAGGRDGRLRGRRRPPACRGRTRRAFLQVGASTVLGLSLADVLRLRARGGTGVSGPAKSVILLWLWGG